MSKQYKKKPETASAIQSGAANRPTFMETSSPNRLDMRALSKVNPNLARFTYSNTTLNITGSKLEQLLREYNRALIEHGFGMRRKDLRQMDTIDTRNLILPSETPWEAPKSNVATEEKAFMITNYWYAFIPCFETGVLHINTGRYIYWEIKKIDMEQNRMDIFLQDYIWYDNSGWNVGVSGVITWTFEAPTDMTDISFLARTYQTQYAVVENHPDYPEPHYDYSTIYRILDPEKDLHWDASAIKLWDEMVVRYATEAKKTFAKNSYKTMLESLAHLFTNYILKINKALSDNKVQKSRPAETKETPEPIADRVSKPTKEKEPKKRRIRTIGPLEITSRTIPRASTRKTVTHYTVASWTRRGHIRTYKNGRKVYIRESKAYRKALRPEQSNSTDIPTTIQFKRKDKP